MCHQVADRRHCVHGVHFIRVDVIWSLFYYSCWFSSDCHICWSFCRCCYSRRWWWWCRWHDGVIRLAVSIDKHPARAAVDLPTHRGKRVVDVVVWTPPYVDDRLRVGLVSGHADPVVGHPACAAVDVEEDGEGRGSRGQRDTATARAGHVNGLIASVHPFHRNNGRNGVKG